MLARRFDIGLPPGEVAVLWGNVEHGVSGDFLGAGHGNASVFSANFRPVP